MIKTNTEKLEVCLNSSQLEGKGLVTKQMPVPVNKPVPQVHFLWKLLWHYPKLNNPVARRKFL